MKTIKQLFSMLIISLLIVSCASNEDRNHSKEEVLPGSTNTGNNNNGNANTDNSNTNNNNVSTGKGSISTKPGGIESANTGRNKYENDTLGTANYKKTENVHSDQQK